MSDDTDDTTGGSDDTRDPTTTPPAVEREDAGREAATAPWAPTTDAGVPGDSAEEKPKPRKAAAPARGGDAPLRRRTEPAPKPKPAASDEPTPEGDRIAKVVARAGIASRRDVEAMIEQGRVSLNGRVLDSPAINVTDADVITVDGEPLPIRERTRLWIFHKPRGLVTTARDPEGRQTVFESLPEDLPRVVAIGRLDINTEGLLLLTNDGGLAKVIAHPDTGWLRRYRVRAHGDTSQAELDKLRKGVTIDGMDYGPVDAVLDRSSGDNLWITLGLREGKNREVKRILEHLGLAVNRLIRLSFGPFQLGDLEVGLVEEIKTKVLKEQLGPALSEQAGVDFASPVREPIAPFGSPKPQAKQPARSASAARGAERRQSDDEAPRPARSYGERAPSRGGDRPVRGPAAPARVPTGGSGAGPRRSVWRSEEEASAQDAPRRVKVPRRGADPKVERETAAARGRERVGAIQTGERRVLVERLKATPQEAAPEPHRRDRGARRDAPEGDARPQRARTDGHEPARAPRAFTPKPAFRRDDRDDRPARRFEGDARPPRRDDQPRSAGRPEGDARPPRRDAGPRPFGRDGAPGAPRQDRGGERGERRGPPAGERPRSFAPSGDRDGARDRGDRPGGGDRGGYKGAGAKPGGFKTGGFKAGGERPGGDRGGFKAGGKPGGFKAGGAKPGGFGARPGGAKPGGFGAKPGGFGAKPGGAKPGGRPGGGAGRPPRGGSR
ncbi:pseudouridine synthase [Methylobacterium sp. Leaf466]|uniref:pseudouridine synthase n=1 Tax=Methylobacterium sp. Leaf466 TaxID=1736386 RepID=UPI0009EA7815|nr:pseudouridine synthase [Methylobacterium sp. Leaf466]